MELAAPHALFLLYFPRGNRPGCPLGTHKGLRGELRTARKTGCNQDEKKEVEEEEEEEDEERIGGCSPSATGRWRCSSSTFFSCHAEFLVCVAQRRSLKCPAGRTAFTFRTVGPLVQELGGRSGYDCLP